MLKYDEPLDLSPEVCHGKLVRYLKKGLTVLEFGCATGRLTKYMTEELGCKVYIVEIVKEAFDIAKNCAVDGVCGNLEENLWKQRFEGLKFDVILFADVLEHLRNPSAALAEAKKLLKTDGFVLFSLPNIAHSDILSKLMCNRFDYTETGLLDNTHIHFFGAENLSDFCKESGLFLSELDGTLAGANTTEQKLQSVEAVIEHKEYGDVYQFVCKAVTAEYAEKNQIKLNNLLKITSRSDVAVSTIYIDSGKGFSEEEKTKISYTRNKPFDNKIMIASGTKSIRFDPNEGAGCVIDRLVIKSDSDKDLAYQTNGYNIDNCLVFANTDPQVVVRFEENEQVKWLNISCNIRIITHSEDLKLISSEVERKLFFEQELQKANALASGEREENTRMNARQNELNAIIEEKERQINNYHDTVCQLENKRLQQQDSLIEKIEQLNGTVGRQNEMTLALNEKNKQIDEINSHCDLLLAAKDKQIDETKSRCESILATKDKQIAELNSYSAQMITKKNEEISDLKLLIKQKTNLLDQNVVEMVALKERNRKNEVLCEDLQEQSETYRIHYLAAIDQREALKLKLAGAESSFTEIRNSFCWKITKPIRICGTIARKILPLRLTVKVFRSIKNIGFRETWKKIKTRLLNRKKLGATTLKISDEERQKQERTTFKKDICFSVVVPLYNTPLNFLTEMIQSVQSQTYKKWELCLADGSDSEHLDVGKAVRAMAKKDKRIKYKKLEKNGGISENTNECLKMASGDFISLFDHDDILHPSALYETMVAICDKSADFVYTDEATFRGKTDNIITAHFKPDYAIDNLRANNYICHFTSFSKRLLKEVGMFRKAFDGSQDHDMVLRLTEKAKHIVHIPKLLYYWRSHPNSVAEDINSKQYAIEAGKKAVKESILRCGYDAVVESSIAFPTIYRIKYDIPKRPLISIIIPNKDCYDDLEKCIKSILSKTTYANYEIIIVDNGSMHRQTLDYYKSLSQNKCIKIKQWNKPFNYSAINNYGVQFARGDYLVLLNNDIEIITPEWLEEMLMFAQRKDVGAVGAKLYYPNNTIQHAGIILGLGAHRVAGHQFYGVPKTNVGYMGRLFYAQDMSAVTAACMMVPKRVYNMVNGLDEGFRIAYNDVDFCLRIRKTGLLIAWTPYAEAYHYESRSRGLEDTEEKQKRFQGEVLRFQEKWKKELRQGDPYYNPNLTLTKSDFSLR